MSKSLFSPGHYTTDLCKCGHHEGEHDWQSRCIYCGPCLQFEQARGISMLESAEEYAREFAKKHGCCIYGLIPKAQPAWNYRDHNCDYPGICTCTGGIPIMKRDCPRHGHLVCSGEERA